MRQSQGSAACSCSVRCLLARLVVTRGAVIPESCSAQRHLERSTENTKIHGIQRDVVKQVHVQIISIQN